MRLVAAAALCIVALAACNRAVKHEPAPVAPSAPVSGFQHEAGFDAQGFYKPAQPVGSGDLKLTGVAVGAPSDFEAFESGRREEVFGPIVMQFEDIGSPLEDAENGQRHAVRVEIKPNAYRLAPGEFAFRGQDAKLGEVAFDGAFDTPALAQAKAGQAEGKPVLSGTLTVGQQKIAGVSFAYQSGD
ncbi:MAG TPA: hypothetical protein VFN88_09995 [Caulobacteraceae bacterium]|nr:hypothetical protein [Caulobacteraceae bacterium]